MIQAKKKPTVWLASEGISFFYCLRHPEHSLLYWHHEHCIPG